MTNPDPHRDRFTRESEGRHAFLLHEGESTLNPASTKHRIHGPALVTYRVHADDSISFTIHDRPGPGARLRYTGPTLEPRPGGIGIPHGARGRLIRWDAGADPDGRALALFEWAMFPGSEIYLNRDELEPIE